MHPQRSDMSYRTFFHLPTGQEQTELVAVANSKIDPSIRIGNDKPFTNTRVYEDIANKLLENNLWTSRRVFVTSPGRGDGKTKVAFSLASELAILGKSVLLAEINFTHPKFRSLLGNLRFRYGLDSAILGMATPAESVFKVEATGLDVAAIRNSRKIKPLDGALDHLNDFFRWSNAHYDLTIVDCPAVLSEEWEKWFHVYIGQALLVVREQQTAAIDVRSAIRLLDGHLLGALLNSSQANGLTPNGSVVTSPDRLRVDPYER